MKLSKLVLVIGLGLMAGACTSVPPAEQTLSDPFADTNRRIFDLNYKIDDFAVEPTAVTYASFVPKPLRLAFANVYRYFTDYRSVVQNLLQGDVKGTSTDVARIFVNTTFGFFGLFDAATDMGLPYENESFPQTLAVWGFAQGPAVQLPFVGPSSVRDTVGRLVDLSFGYGIPTYYYGLSVADTLETRAALTGVTSIFSVDQYAGIRDSWYQHHIYTIVDGDVPDNETDGALDDILDDDFFFDDEPADDMPSGASGDEPASVTLPSPWDA